MRIAIFTFDRDSWTVAPFLHYFQKAWPDCPHPIDIVTTRKKLPYPNVVYLGKDMRFESNLLSYINNYLADRREPILIMLSDLIPCDPDLNILNAAIREIERPDVAMVRVHPSPGPTLPWSELIGEVDISTPYAVTLQYTIWKPDFIRLIARSGSSAGDMESAGERIPKDYKLHLLATKNSALSPRNLIYQGNVSQETTDWMKENP